MIVIIICEIPIWIFVRSQYKYLAFLQTSEATCLIIWKKVGTYWESGFWVVV